MSCELMVGCYDGTEPGFKNKLDAKELLYAINSK